jgi:polar amino acid transport system permease protein
MTPENIEFMIKSAGYSLAIALCALLGGSILGLLAAAAKLSHIKIFKAIAHIYCEVFRGTPMLLQIMLFYLAGPVITKTLAGFVYTPNPYVIGAISIAINSGAYETELFRSVIQAVDKGQWEASHTIGLTYFQTMRYVILPQAFRRVIPPFINEFIVLIKDSSLLSTIGAIELLRSAQILTSNYYNFFVPYTSAAIVYLLMTMTISNIARGVERRLAESD